jgi:hypothetical protein
MDEFSEMLAAIRDRDLKTPEFWFKRPASAYGLREQSEAYAIQDRRELLAILAKLTFI